MNPSRPDSYEALAHDTGLGRFLLDLRSLEEPLRGRLAERRLERFIGVIYRPHTERWSHYVSCDLTRQLDAWVWFDETRAVQPTSRPTTATGHGAEDTYPFGL